MGDTTADERSQPILRVPRDKTPGELILIDGERAYVLFYVPPGECLTRVFEDTAPFVPVAVGSVTRMVARAAIACMSAHTAHVTLPNQELVHEAQPAIVRMRGGHDVRGELRWIAPYGHRRTLDHLNDAATHVVVLADEHVHFVAKSAIISVEEY